MTEEIVKICKVHGELTYNSCYFYLKKEKKRFNCKKCEKLRSTLYRKKNPDKVKEWSKRYANSEKGRKTQKKWNDNNLEKVKKIKYQWALNNPEKRKESINKSNKKRSEINREHSLRRVKNLTDSYVVSTIKQNGILKTKDIPSILIETKRNYIKLVRYLKDLKNGAK